MTPRKPLNTQVYAEASEWLVEFRWGDADGVARKEFHTWLKTSPGHMRAYLELAALWNEGGNLDRERQFDADVLMRDVRAQGSNVISAPSATPQTPTPTSLFLRPLALAASLLLVVLAGIGGWLYFERGVYSTDVGEQRALTLSDGSRVELNARSKIRVRFSGTGRSIALLRGQAFFKVAADPHRPLVVTSEDTQVRALGTQFDVYRKRDSTVVTVVEGKVAVSSARNEDRTTHVLAPVTLDAGEQAVVTAKETLKHTPSDVAAATAWTEGRLVFEAAPLREVAEEFNRYNATPLVIGDPTLADFRVTGIFASTDPASLIRFLQARPGIVVTQAGHEIRVTQNP